MSNKAPFRSALVIVSSLLGSNIVVAQGPMERWESSPHADSSSPSFTHWDKDGVIPGNCASCHSGTGFLDFLGGDGSTEFKMDKEHATGSVVDCQSCHHPAAESLDTVTFPSGVVLNEVESSATCMTCHQGRAASTTVEEKVANLAEDAVDESLSFINIHYRAAAATLLGVEAHGGYEYPGKEYAGRFTHVPEFADCTDCHNPHDLMVSEASCVQCHQNDETINIRTRSADADSDGDTKEGVAGEIDTIQQQLLVVIGAYATSLAEQPIVYNAHAYPYFFNDKNGNGTADKDEAIYPNKYQSWTPRLLKAAYNYQFVAKDPGAYAHNPDYVIQIMIDSVNDLSAVLKLDGTGYIRP